MKKLSLKQEGGGGGGAAEEMDESSGTGAAAAGDMKWRNELTSKMTQARKTVEAEYDPELSDKADDVFNDFIGKLEKVWGDSAKASTKSQKTECEKKIEKLAKAALKQLKEVKEEEKGAGGVKTKKKSDMIREKVEAKKEVNDVEDDAQIIGNVLSKFKRSLVPSLMGLKDHLKTQHGRLQWMLEVIKAGLSQRPRDDVLILDCLFALM